MPAHSVSVLLVGLSPELTALVVEGARLIWPEVKVEPFPSGDELAERPRQRGLELVVVGPDVAETDRLQIATLPGRDGGPRWPVLVFADGLASGDLSFVSPTQRSATALANLMQLTASHHVARREASRALGDLRTIARRISHEMRSPLGCVLTSADVIREELADVVPAAGELAQPIVDSAHEMMELIERVTLVARASALPPTPVAVEMHLMVWAARERLAVRIQEIGAEISEPAEWPSVIGHPEWLERIWLNLIGNALQHAGPRPHIEIGWKPGSGETEFFVRDNGTGVPAEVVPMLFRPFHQLHLHNSGRGLGLAIVQRLVELQGGRSGYESVSPHGAYFYFTVPADAGESRG